MGSVSSGLTGFFATFARLSNPSRLIGMGWQYRLHLAGSGAHALPLAECPALAHPTFHRPSSQEATRCPIR